MKALEYLKTHPVKGGSSESETWLCRMGAPISARGHYDSQTAFRETAVTFLLDTNVVIDLFKGKCDRSAFLQDL